MKFSSALVTGGAGFIGSHVCEALCARGVRVRVLDDLSMGVKENVPDRVELMIGSILDEEALTKAVEGMDVVFHLAARVSIRASTKGFVDDAQINLMGTLEVLNAAAQAGIKKVVFASSMAVYGEAEYNPQDESHPLRPISAYGIGKLAAEKYTLLMSEHLGFDAVALRFFNTFGARQTLTPYVGVMTIFINRLMNGQAPVIFGDGDQQRDFVYVGDVAESTVRTMESDATGIVLNVGTGRATSVNELAHILCQNVDASITPRYADAQAGETRLSVAGVDRLRDVIGFVPATTIEERLDDVVAFLRTRNTEGSA